MYVEPLVHFAGIALVLGHTQTLNIGTYIQNCCILIKRKWINTSWKDVIRWNHHSFHFEAIGTPCGEDLLFQWTWATICLLSRELDEDNWICRKSPGSGEETRGVFYPDQVLQPRASGSRCERHMFTGWGGEDTEETEDNLLDHWPHPHKHKPVILRRHFLLIIMIITINRPSVGRPL